MISVVPDILARIATHKRAELPRLSPQREEWERQAAGRPVRDFRAALLAHPPAVIAEMKKASPSKGVFTNDFDPAAIARSYFEGGAAAMSVLTDEQFFQGSLADLGTARAAAPLPALRKDFTIDEVHVVQAAAHGADAILLIAALLTESELRRFRELAAEYGMAAIVEVHDADELDAALGSGAGIIGVNNRNLRTFEVTLDTSLRLAEKIPAGLIKISESGIESNADVRMLTGAGYQAFLVGEHLMRSGNPAQALRALRGQSV